MNKEAIEKRISELRKTLEQLQANGNAVIGAIQECEYWLRILAEGAKKVTEKKKGNG